MSPQNLSFADAPVLRVRRLPRWFEASSHVYRENTLKAKLRSGEPTLGCWLFMGSPVVGELLAHAGFDALIVDHEHAPGGLLRDGAIRAVTTGKP